MRFFSDLFRKLRDAYTGRRSAWVNRWRVRGWRERIDMLVPVLAGAFILVLSAGVAIWIAMWFFFGPPSVNIAGVMVDLDRSASLAGVDRDKNGIRDDIDEYIKVLAKKKAYDEPQVKALQQDARATQSLVVVDLSDAKAILAVSELDNKSGWCLFLKFKEMDAYQIRRQFEKITVNTRQRTLAYMKFNHAMDGTVSTSPSGDTCEK